MQLCVGRRALSGLSVLFGGLAFTQIVNADIPVSAYQRPQADIVATLTATPPPTPLIHAASQQVALLFEQATIPSARFSQPYLGIAGYRYYPATHSSGMTTLLEKIEILDLHATTVGARHEWIPAPDSGFDHAQFSPAGHYLSAVQQSVNDTHLVIFDTQSGKSRNLPVAINAAWGSPCHWLNEEELLCLLRIHAGSGAPQQVPTPTIVNHNGGPAPVRTYRNLLENANDNRQFEYYFSSILGRVNINGQVQLLPAIQGLIASIDPAPTGAFGVIKRIEKPYSQLVKADNFPSRIEVWDLDKQQQLYASAVAGFNIESREEERDSARRFAWKPGLPPTLGWISKAEDAQGKPLFRWWSKDSVSPNATLLAESAQSFADFGWTTAGTPYYSVRTADGNGMQIYRVQNATSQLLATLRINDKYADPGTALRTNGDQGAIIEHQGRIYLAGDGLSISGPQPFLDQLDLTTLKLTRLFQAEPGTYETVLAVLNDNATRLLTSSETQTSPPNLYILNNKQRQALRPFADPYPALHALQREVIAYTRQDGVALKGTLYRPAQAQPGVPLPTLVWIYPYEYSDPQQAEQPNVRWYRFHSIKGPSPIPLALAGYNVLINPTIPIIQDGDELSDNYLEQLISSADAAVDYLVKSGTSTADRIAVGGQSYGAFSSANLLIHSNRFATAIVLSGAYNRTLTPFGFQHEKRTFWQATDYYTRISPFFFADQLKKPILLMHGGADANPGTPTFQSRRFFHALVGEGVKARYVELPFEDHHFRGTDNVLHTVKEMQDWLDNTIGSAAPLKSP